MIYVRLDWEFKKVCLVVSVFAVQRLGWYGFINYTTSDMVIFLILANGFLRWKGGKLWMFCMPWLKEKTLSYSTLLLTFVGKGSQQLVVRLPL